MWSLEKPRQKHQASLFVLIFVYTLAAKSPEIRAPFGIIRTSVDLLQTWSYIFLKMSEHDSNLTIWVTATASSWRTIHSLGIKICFRFQSLLFTNIRQLERDRWKCLYVCNQNTFQKRTSKATKFIIRKLRRKRKTVLETKKIILTAKGGYTWAVCMDKLACDSFFH